MNRYITLLILCAMLTFPLRSQNKFISDTTIINVPVDTTLSKINATINSIHDTRIGAEDVLRITQKNIYNYIPVDHYINTSKPLGDYIPLFFDGDEKNMYNFTVKRFEVTTRKGLFFPALSLNATIDVEKYSESNTDILKGTFIYNKEINARTKGKKPGDKEKKLLAQWEKEFVQDMQQLTRYKNNQNSTLPYNFRSANQEYRTNLLVNTRFIGGLDFWMVEGEVVFAEPEASKRFRQSGYMVRYRNEKRFESIAFSRNSEHFLYRVNNNLLFDINTNFMVGVNKWKDMWEEEHPIWHIILLDLSATQYLLYTPFNSEPGFIIGAGVLENVYYVPDGLFKFKPGLGIQIGYRF